MTAPDYAASALLGVCMVSFFVVNIFNIRHGTRSRRGIETYAEAPEPSAFLEYLAGFATALVFLLSAFYVILTFSGYLYDWPLAALQFSELFYLKIVGIVLTVGGYGLFIWSVLARGRYSVSWNMPRNHKLVTWGPYRYVRHPSYTGYFLMFIGLFLVWMNLIAAIPLLGIIGYGRIAGHEEQLLVKRFGEAYTTYQSTTGRFIPRMHRARQ